MAMASIEARDEHQQFWRRPARVAGGLVLAGLAAWLGTALATWNVTDPSLSLAGDTPVTNFAGPSGAVVADLAMQMFGRLPSSCRVVDDLGAEARLRPADRARLPPGLARLRGHCPCQRRARLLLGAGRLAAADRPRRDRRRPRPEIPRARQRRLPFRHRRHGARRAPRRSGRLVVPQRRLADRTHPRRTDASDGGATRRPAPGSRA